MNQKIFTLTQLSKYLEKDKRTLYNMIKDGRFPVPPIVGTSPRLWNLEDIDAWRFNKDAK